MNLIASEPLEPRRHFAVDLVAGPFRANMAYVGITEPINGHLDFVNLGDDATASPLEYQVVLATDAALTQNLRVIVEASSAGALPAFDANNPAAQRPVFNVAPPTDLFGQTLYLGLILDPDNSIAESDEANNRVAASEQLILCKTFTDGTFTGTGENDSLEFFAFEETLRIKTVFGGVTRNLMADADDVTSLTIDMDGGNDFVVGQGFTPATIRGGTGSDSLVGGNGDDSIDGGSGKDFIEGGAGDDYLLGGGQSDRLVGGRSRNPISADGKDTLSGGGGRDFLTGGSGADVLLGGAGNDLFFSTGDSSIDTLSGNAGSDFAEADENDLITSVETLA